MGARAWARALALLGGVALAFASALPAGATTIQVNDTFAGNDCGTVFNPGTGFGDCRIPGNIDPDESPIIIKFNYTNGMPGLVEINSELFPSINGGEFVIVLLGDGGTGIDWTYTPGPGDPGITYWVAKGGPSFNLFTDDSGGAVTTGTWFTPLVGNSQDPNPSALSHISFYDTGGGGNVPEPGTLLLAGAALAALGMMRRRPT